ncbi:MAG: hypothetical protein GY778_20615 [bacterium]|nr:hypothetical protein [bacterium]
MTLRGCGYDSDTERIRAGLAVLVVGIVIILAALFMLYLRGPADPGEMIARQGQPGSAVGSRAPARLGAWVMVLGVFLVAALVVAALTLLRITRRFAGRRDDKPQRPTPTDDVWAMHQTPEEPPDAAPPDATDRQT